MAYQPIPTPVSVLGSVSGVGTFTTLQSGTRVTSLVSAVPSSVLVGASIFGTAPVTQAGTWIASVFGNVSVIGAVPVTQSTTPWVVDFQNSSVLSVPAGSTIAVIQANSVAGTYSDDSAHTNGVRGLLTLGVRNDTMASITSADNDYTHFTSGPSGEAVVANSPITRWVSGQTSVMYGSSVQAIPAQGASVFTYITGLQVVNASANNAIVRLTGGLGSVLAWTVAPANGGSNIIYPNPLKTGENSGFSASISGVASVYVSAQGFTARI